MKATIFPLWWNPWGESGIDFDDIKVSISVDNLTYDKDADYRILFLAEPYAIAPTINEGALRNSHAFDRIYTFGQAILDKYKTAELFPWGSSWLDFKDLKINKKNHITFVTSSKSQAPGHELRLSIYDVLANLEQVNGLEIYQHQSPPFHQRRNDFFESAKFHIAVENSQQKNYFTEKVIDCFASKTIPIYYGCPNLDDWFNMDGVITFNSIKDLENIFEYIDEDYYDSRQAAIEENYEIAKKFHSDNDVVPRLTRKIISDVKENATQRI
jgi:hypothetical protein